MNTRRRLALVTGASRGIGRAAALALAGRGAHVVCLARTRDALEELNDEIAGTGGRCSVVSTDLRETEALSRLSSSFAERFGRLDALVLNAATLGDLAPVADLSGAVLSDALAVNVTANWQLLASLDPLLRASGAARVVGITSSRARRSVPLGFVYAASKAAFEQLVLTYAAERVASAVKANLLDPGPVATDMRAEAVPDEDPSTITQPAEIGALVAEMADERWQDTGDLVRFTGRWSRHRIPLDDAA